MIKNIVNMVVFTIYMLRKATITRPHVTLVVFEEHRLIIG